MEYNFQLLMEMDVCVYFFNLINTFHLFLINTVRHDHGPGWAGSVPVPSGFGSIWNLSRPVPVSVPGGSKRFLGSS